MKWFTRSTTLKLGLATGIATSMWVAHLDAFSPAAHAQDHVGSNALTHKVSLPGLDKEELMHIRNDVMELFAMNPHIFARLDDMKAYAIDADRNKRGRLAPLRKAFEGLGDEAFLPMLYVIATDEPFATPMHLTAWTAYRAGMIEAVGMFRDTRSAPVLLSVIRGPEVNSVILRTATEALGRLGDEHVIAEIVGIIDTVEDYKRNAILAGLGTARRIQTAKYLVSALEQTDSAQTQRVILTAIGDLANAWAWQTPVLDALGEAQLVRETSARALLNFYIHTNDEQLRVEATKSILLANAPDTLQWIETLSKSSSQDQQEALKTLAERLHNSPLNR